MNEMLLSLAIGYIFLTALLMLVLIYGRLHWLLKGGLLIVVVCFYGVSYQGWKETQGWPSRVTLPEKFLLHYVVVEEPDEELAVSGNIFMWLTDLYDEKPAETPRAYRLAYDRDLHGKLNEAMRQQRNGSLQLGVLKASQKNPNTAESKKKLGHKYENLEFVKLPDPALPEK